ncbi:MAG: hypothetical protein H0X45_05880 [Planctomycetes bacterium]|nr:hypothetical protein [Planctomycetota bacterium]
MLHDIHVFLHEYRWFVLVVTVPGIIVSIRIFLAHLAAATPPTSTPRQPGVLIRPHGKPSPKFAETVKAEDFPRTLDAGVAAHLDKSRAATDKLAPVTVGGDTKPSDDDEAMGDLFAGLGDDTATMAKGDSAKHDPTKGHSAKEATTSRKAISETAAIRRVARLDEIGFHHSIPSDKVEPGRAPPMPVDVPAASATTVVTPVSPVDAAKARLQELGLSGGAAGSSEAAKPAAPELDAILARIDQVLSQDQKKTEVDIRSAASKSDARLRPTETMQPEPRRPDPRQAATQVLQPVPDPDAPAKPDAAKIETKKATPLWARADAFDEDADKTDAKKDDGQQLGLFDKDKT